MEVPLVEDRRGVEAHRAAEDHRVEARLVEDPPVEEVLGEVAKEVVHHHLVHPAAVHQAVAVVEAAVAVEAVVV